MNWKLIEDKSWCSLEQQFEWVREMNTVQQDIRYHAEGSVAEHTRMVLEALQQSSAYHSLSTLEKELIWTSALLHDVEKRSTSVDEGEGRVSAKGHARKGEYTVRTILYRDCPAPFHIREQIASLVRYHGLPVWLMEKPDSVKKLCEASLRVDTSLLKMLADADIRGRICEDKNELLEALELFEIFCREQDCWKKPREFATDYARFHYFHTEDSYIDYVPHEQFKCEVTMLSGLPGMGKDAIIVANKSGLVAFKAKVFIDATGDGDVATWAGASFKKGGEDGILQSSTLCFSFANVDSYNYNLIGPSLHTSNKNSPIFDAIKSGKYPLIGRHFNSNLIGPDVVQFNAGHIDNVDSTDPWATTRAMATGRQIAEQYLEALKELQPKTFGSAFVVKTASLLGVRDSRRIEGDYTFTFQDWLERKTFEDEIGRNCYYIDVHKPGHKETRYKKGESHGIPYRCLTPKGMKNLLTAGRCISTDEEAFGSLRVMPPCLVTGEAAGMAAVHAIKQTKNDVHKIDVGFLRKRLKEEGQYFL